MSTNLPEVNPLVEKYVGKYLGPDKIVGVELLKMTTPSGLAVFEFETQRKSEDGATVYTEKEIVPEKSVAIAVADQPHDYTKVFTDKMNIVVKEVVAVLDEYNLDYYQMDAVNKSLTAVTDMRFNRALSFLFTGDDKNFIPGIDPRNTVSLLGVEKILSEIPKPDVES